MRILFIWPNKGSFGLKPISLALLSGILKRQGHDVEVFDTTFMDFGYKDNSEILSKLRSFKAVDFGQYDVGKTKVDLQDALLSRLRDFNPDMVGVSALSDEIAIGMDASRIVKDWRGDVPVVWGNKAATMNPGKLLASGAVDFACVGEGFEFVTNILDCLARKTDPRSIKNIAWIDEQGGLRRNELSPFFQELDSLPILDWSVFDHRQFLRPFEGQVHVAGDHMISWGCPNRCTYCINDAYRKLYGSRAGSFLRSYGVKRIAGELKHLTDRWGLTFFKFQDEDFCLKPLRYFRELAQEYRQQVGLPFSAMAHARSLGAEKVALLKQMNCVSISIGIETGNEALRRNVLKRSESKDDIIEAVHRLNDAGIRTSGFNMLGIPYETRATVMETIELNRESGVRYPNTVFFYPLEGTELRDMAIQGGFFDGDKDSMFDDVNPSLTLNAIAAAELVALRERFVLYVKLPREYFRYIERSEQRDRVGEELTEALFSIYDECVLLSDGVWKGGGRDEHYLSTLQRIHPG